MTQSVNHRYLQCRAASLEFVLALEDLREVSHVLTIFAIPHAPKGVRGLLSLRGETHLVLDVGQLLTGSAVTIESCARLLFCKPQAGPSLALLVSYVGDMIQCLPEHLKPLVKQKSGEPMGYDSKIENLILPVNDGLVPFGRRNLPILSAKKLYHSVENHIQAQAIEYAPTAIANGVTS